MHTVTTVNLSLVPSNESTTFRTPPMMEDVLRGGTGGGATEATTSPVANVGVSVADPARSLSLL